MPSNAPLILFWTHYFGQSVDIAAIAPQAYAAYLAW